MKFYKRALASVARKLGKSLILLLLVFLLGTVIAGAVSISQAVVNTEANLRRSLPPVVTISEDFQLTDAYWQEHGQAPEGLNPAMFRQISQLPYIQTFDYSLRADWVEVEGFLDYGWEDSSLLWGDERGPLRLNARGVSNPDILDALQGFIEITDGRAFTLAETEQLEEIVPVVVSREFASVNNLNVGSTFEPFLRFYPIEPGNMLFREPDPDAEPIFEETFTFQVVGLFELGPNHERDEDQPWRELQALNRVYMPNIHVEHIDILAHAGMALQFEGMDEAFEFERVTHFDNVFVLNDINDVEAFRQAAASILPPTFRVQDLSSTFAHISGSMESMLGIANIILWVSVGATLIILSLLITLFLRDRKREIGIYLALGEKKINIIAQILMEVLMVAIVGITLSLFAGNVISEGMSSQMLRNQMIAEMESGNFWGEWNPLEHLGFDNHMTMDEMLENYQVSLDGQTIALFYLVGTGTVILSTLVPILYVTSLNPKKILM